MAGAALEVEHDHRHCQCCTLGDGTHPIFFFNDGPLVGDINDVKMTVQDFLFPRLVFELSAKKTFKRLSTGQRPDVVVENLVKTTPTSQWQKYSKGNS